MALLKKVAKAVAKGAKKGARLAGRVAKTSPPYRAGQVAGSLARGRAPRRRDVLGALGVPTATRGGRRAAMPEQMREALKARAPRMPIAPARRMMRTKTAPVSSSTSMGPTGRTAASSVVRSPVRRRRQTARSRGRTGVQ